MSRAIITSLLVCLVPLSSVAANLGGGHIATLGSFAGASTDFAVGQTVGSAWAHRTSVTSVNIHYRVDISPGSMIWAVTLEAGNPSSTQDCTSVTYSTVLTLSSLTSSVRGEDSDNNPVSITGPFCYRVRFVLTNPLSRTSLGGGTLTITFNDNLMDCQAATSGGDGSATSVWLGNISRSSDFDRNWCITGVAISAVGGFVTIPVAAGSGVTWHLQVRYTAALTNGQSCDDAKASGATTSDLGTISGTTQLNTSWTPASVSIPANACLQLVMTSSGGTPASMGTVSPYMSLDLTPVDSSVIPLSFGTAGSGSFNFNHAFANGTWAISDGANVGPGLTPNIGQQFYLGPSIILNRISGAFTFTAAIGGTGQFDVGITYSTAAPSTTQGCLDMTYTSSAAFCSLTVGSKGCHFDLKNVVIPANACFALNVSSSVGTPTAAVGNQFNWQVTALQARSSSIGGNATISGNGSIH